MSRTFARGLTVTGVGRHSGRDRELLRRVARRAAVQTGVLVFLAFCLCAGVVLLLVWRAQANDDVATLRDAASHADDVTDPPNGVWLVVQPANGPPKVTPGAPDFLPYRPAIAKLTASTTSVQEDVHTPRDEYRVLTTREDGRVVQAALSLAGQHAERARLLEALAVSGAVAIAAAGLLGAAAGRRSAAPLADALARQRSFVADASHELRTPLTHLTTRAQLIERGLARGDATGAQEDTKALLVDSRRLTATLEDLLVAAEPVNPAGWERLGLADVVAAVAEAVTPDAAQAGVQLLVSEPQSGAGPLQVIAPRTAVERALLALLDNAIRHTPEGGEVRIRLSRDGAWAVLSVTDTGSGIAEAQMRRMFDRFSHGSTAHTQRRRFGIGLALVADSVERLGGDVTVTSRPGAGTTMTVRLPAASRHTRARWSPVGRRARRGPGKGSRL